MIIIFLEDKDTKGIKTTTSSTRQVLKIKYMRILWLSDVLFVDIAILISF